MNRPPVTLQVSLAPSDHRVAEFLLPHQLRAWGGAVGEILLTVDTQRSRGRFGQDWAAGRDRIMALCREATGARVLEVDYSDAARAAVAGEFFNGNPVPVKDCRGGPYYAYFFGLHAAANEFVLHTDADMFIGGDPVRWLDEAMVRYAADPTLLFTAPLPGPPAADGRLRQLTGERMPETSPAYRFAEMSTRLFLFDRGRFREKIRGLVPRPPRGRARMRAFLDGHPAEELPEVLLSTAMNSAGMKRIDFLGTPGCWSLHPPYRSADFFAKLPELVRRVEAGDLPPGQIGDHDLNASLVDWTAAIERMSQNRWWHRLAARFSRADN